VRLDRVDWAILRDLYRWDTTNLPRGPLRVSLHELATRTGLHRNTVQARIAAMRRLGVLGGPVFEPRPAPLGLVRSGFLFRGTRFSDGDALMEALADFPFISSAVLCLDHVFLHLWHERDTVPAEDAKSIRDALDADEVTEGYASTRFPREDGDEVRMSPAEMRLVLALRRNPLRSMAAMAHELGLPTHTVERRAARLIQRGAGAMVPLLRLSRVEGWIVVHYIASPGNDRAASGLAAAFPDRVIGPFGSGQIPTVMVPLSSMAEVEKRRWEAERIPGVGPLRAVLLQDAVYPDAFEDWLAEHVETVQSDVARTEIAARV